MNAWNFLGAAVLALIASPLQLNSVNGLVGKKGKIKSIDGDRFISIDQKLYSFTSSDNKKIMLGQSYEVKEVHNDIVVI